MILLWQKRKYSGLQSYTSSQQSCNKTHLIIPRSLFTPSSYSCFLVLISMSASGSLHSLQLLLAHKDVARRQGTVGLALTIVVRDVKELAMLWQSAGSMLRQAIRLAH
jgi:hypothetical protein